MKRLAILLVLFLFACQTTYQPAVPVDEIMNGPSNVVPRPVEEVAEPVEVVEPEVVEVVEEPVEVVEEEPEQGEVINIDVILKGEHATINVQFENGEEEFSVDHNDKEVILGILAGKYELSTTRTERITTFLQEAGKEEKEEEFDEEAITSTKVIEILGYKYTPEMLYIKPHTRVVWNHKDLATHTVTAVNGLFNSNDLQRGDSFTYDFHEYGTYEYFSSPYPSMRGKIVVQD